MLLEIPQRLEKLTVEGNMSLQKRLAELLRL